VVPAKFHPCGADSIRAEESAVSAGGNSCVRQRDRPLAAQKAVRAAQTRYVRTRMQSVRRKVLSCGREIAASQRKAQAVRRKLDPWEQNRVTRARKSPFAGWRTVGPLHRKCEVALICPFLQRERYYGAVTL